MTHTDSLINFIIILLICICVKSVKLNVYILYYIIITMYPLYFVTGKNIYLLMEYNAKFIEDCKMDNTVNETK